MTESELKQISINNRKLEQLKGKYSSLKYKSLTKGQVLTGMPHVPGIKDTIGNYVSELEELKDDIALLEMENNLLVKKARRFITEIPDYIIQAIIELKYINNLYTNEIVACIGVKEIDRDGDINRILKTFFLEQVLYM